MVEAKGLKLGGRVLLALLTLYALTMIVPDFLRIVRPLSSFGLTTNADGLIYDVQGPFAEEEESPAWKAGLRVGDRLDLGAMRCASIDSQVCASNLALWGGVNYVMPGREARLLVKAAENRPTREIVLVAEQRQRSVALDAVVLLAGIAGVLVVLGAAYLVWIRPGAMTWGFFAYVIQFNPGQAYQFYAFLQQWPWALLAQDIASCVLQAVGYTGLLLFALRAPVDKCEGRWRAIERALPALFVVFLAVALASSRKRLRPSYRVRHGGFDPDRICGQRRRAGDLDWPPRGSVATRLSAHPLGDLGLPHRAAGLSNRGNLAGDLAFCKPVR